MKKLIYVLMLVLALGATPVTLSSCATTTTNAVGQTVKLSPIEQAQDNATKATLVLGTVFTSAPGIILTARQNGKISKEQYNSSVDIYNQALGSYALLNKALQTTILLGEDPSNAQNYQTALAAFLLDKKNLDNLIAAMGQPATGVK